MHDSFRFGDCYCISSIARLFHCIGTNFDCDTHDIQILRLDQTSPLLVQLDQIPHVVNLDLCKIAERSLVDTLEPL